MSFQKVMDVESDLADGLDADPDPFMLVQKVYPIRKEKRDKIPAMTHVDGNCPLQAVYERTNPAYD